MVNFFSKKAYQIEFCGQKSTVTLRYQDYLNNGSLAVSLYRKCIEDDSEELFGTITVNLPNSAFLPFGVQFVDINNFPNITRWLEVNNLAKPLGFSIRSGFVDYPAYEFILDEMTSDD